MHVDNVKGTAPKEAAAPLFCHLNASVGQCKADYGSFLHTGMQHEHSRGRVFTHQYAYVDSMSPVKTEFYAGKGDEALCDGPCHEACRSVPGAVAWIVLTRAGLAVYVQALQRRAHAPRAIDCKRLILVTRYMTKHKRGLKTVSLKHPLKLVGCTDAAFKAQPDEPTGLALRGLVATLQKDSPTNDQPHGVGGLVNVVAFTVRRQRRVVRSTSSAELHGLVDSVEQLLLLQITLHHIYCCTHRSPEDMIDLLEHGGLYPSYDVAVDAKAVFYAVEATDACDSQGCPLKLHLISVRDRLSQGIIRRMH